MANKALKRTMEVFLRMLRSSARKHMQGLRHYTTMSSLMKMITSEKIYFSLLQNSNDGGEDKSTCHYMLCFNYEKEENIALWALYGVPRNDSIRLTFLHSDIMAWLDSVKNGELEFYGVEDARRSVLLKDACPKVSVCDVAYYGGTGGNIFTHKGKTFRVVCEGQRDRKPYQDSRLKPYAKKWAWSYEQEVRIVLEFDKPVFNSKGKPYGRIAVDFDEPLQALLEGHGGIRLGPWCRRSAETVRKRCFPKASIQESAFKDLVKFRTPCSECDKKKRKSCKCKYKNM